MSEARVLEPDARLGAGRARRPHILGNSLHQEPEYRGLELQRIRQSLGLSGNDIADALGINVQKVRYAESGHPSYWRVRKREQAWLREHILKYWPRISTNER